MLSAVSHDAIVRSGDLTVEPISRTRRSPKRRRGWLMRRLLLVSDVLGLLLAFALAAALVSPGTTEDRVGSIWQVLLFASTLPLWVLLARVHGLYDRDEERTDHSTVDDVVGVFQVLTLGTWGFLVVTHLFELAHPSLPRLVLFWLIGVGLVPVLRAAMRSIGRRRPAYVQNVLIVGSGQVARLLALKMAKHPEYGLRVIGFVDRLESDHANVADAPAMVGVTDRLRELIAQHGVERVVIAFSTDSHERTLDVIRALQDTDVQIDIVPRMFEALGTSAQLHTIEGVPLVGLPSTRLSSSSKLLKRIFDLAAACAGLVLLAPMLVVIALAIKLDSRGPVFFRQLRVGAYNRPFLVFKFRTMVVDAEAQKSSLAHLNMHNASDPRMFKIPNDPRVTRVGRFLRRWRLDELPQLVNVILGQMSLVGPRPLILDEDRCVPTWARRRLDLKPGMTGLWQVLGASDIPFDEMTKLDYLYVTNWSLREDLRLILLTLPSLARARAAY